MYIKLSLQYRAKETAFRLSIKVVGFGCGLVSNGADQCCKGLVYVEARFGGRLQICTRTVTGC